MRLIAGGAALVAAGLVLLLLYIDEDEKGSGSRSSGGDPIAAVKPCRQTRDDGSKALPPTLAHTGRAGHETRSADDFVGSVGVNIHLGYPDTPYARHDAVRDKLRQLGVRYVRDTAVPGQPAVYRTMRALAKSGIRVNLLVGDPLRRHGSGSLEQQLTLVKRQLLPAVASLEAPNEFDNQGYANWRPVLREYQQCLFDLVNSDRALAHLPVVGPSLIDLKSYGRLGNMSRYLDYGNVHSYPGGAPPDDDSQMRFDLQQAAKVAGSKRIQATETGYHNGVNTQAADHPPASEQAAAVYLPRLYLDYFRRGVARTFAYELIDEHPDPQRNHPEADFGLLRNDLSEKPAFTALSRLTGLLSDRGPSFRPSTLRYSVEGAPPSLRGLALQKRDGSFYLALWNAVRVWDPNKGSPLNPPDDEVRLTLRGVASRVETYRPNESGAPVLQLSNVRSLRLRLSPSVTIVKIVPRRR
jgi:hypothetical protein